MAFNLKGRHLLSLEDYSKKEIEYLIDLASELKKTKNMQVSDHVT